MNPYQVRSNNNTNNMDWYGGKPRKQKGVIEEKRKRK